MEQVLSLSRPSSSIPGQEPGPPVSLVAVVVLYGIATEQSVTLQSLGRSASSAGTAVELTTLVVDNSPESRIQPTDAPPSLHYLACPGNLGLANAYNQGIRLAERIGARWLLTLDQDTALPPDFLPLMAAHARRLEEDPSHAAILPQAYAGEVPLSPFFWRWGGLPTYFPRGYTGVPEQLVSGINSGSMLRVDALVQAGGYDPLFWLDASDMAIFDRLHRLGKRAMVAGDVQVQHELSLKNLQERVSPVRYRHMLLAESAFWDEAMPLSAGLERTLRLALRLLRQIRRREDSALRSITLRFLLLRLFRSARHRRRLFLEAVRQRLGDYLAATALPPRRPMVSVCMASYNSGRYIDLQLASILPQLEVGDEILIVDDNSTDGTPERILAFADPRIRLVRHTGNTGVARAFEHALRAATGDLLFLSDHDDIWAPDKVRLFREAFAGKPDVQLVISAVSLIDAEGVPFRDQRFDRDGRAQRGFFVNMLKNGYQGSALAFRSGLLASLLPFSPDRTYLHDAWIGTLNDRLRGGTVFLPQPLLFYRRHAANVSQRMSTRERIVSRVQLLWDHLRHALAGRGRRRRNLSE